MVPVTVQTTNWGDTTSTPKHAGSRMAVGRRVRADPPESWRAQTATEMLGLPPSGTIFSLFEYGGIL